MNIFVDDRRNKKQQPNNNKDSIIISSLIDVLYGKVIFPYKMLADAGLGWIGSYRFRKSFHV